MLSLHGCTRAFSSCSKQGLLTSRVRGLLITVASLVAVWALECVGSVGVTLRLRWPTPCGVFPHQGVNPCPLHWQVDSYPMDHQGNPGIFHFQ